MSLTDLQPPTGILRPSSRMPVYVVAEATDDDREQISRLRHEIYSDELRQHPNNPEARLQDALDAHNMYLAVRVGPAVAGFISITLPDAPSLSIDKYFKRGDLPCEITPETFEVRLLTVRKQYRGADIAGLLVYAAYRWIVARGGRRIVAIGRADLLSFYERLGLQPSGHTATSGALTYEFMWADTDALEPKVQQFINVIKRYHKNSIWTLSIPFLRPSPCFHGGAFFSAVGEHFDTLEKSKEIINADVLDAWFDAAPSVISTVAEYLPWLMKTSPPTNCDGLIDAVAEARRISRNCILPGAGSSDLIFRALPTFLNADSRVLILDPTYGEYSHILERVIRCRVDRFKLLRTNAYIADLDELAEAMQQAYDLIILVNPNSPTGRHSAKHDLLRMLKRIRPRTRVWIDETYIEYVGAHESLESYAATSENVIVCKSMSKVYALSGARVAYLCAAPHQLETLRSLSPPWAVALPAQVAAVYALQASQYYEERYAQTHTERLFVTEKLRALRCDVIDGVANFLLCHLPEDGPSAAYVVDNCRRKNVFIRDAGKMSALLGERAVRIAVRSHTENLRIIDAVRSSLS